MQRLVGLFLILPLTACTPGRAAMVAGGGLVVLGGISMATGDLATDISRGEQGDELITKGAGLAVAGVLLVVLGLVSESSSERSEKVAPLPCAPCVTTDPLLTAPPGVVEGTESEGRGTVEDRTRINIRLAQQASSAAQRGECDAANAAADRLARVAPETHEALLRVDPDVARCVTAR